MTQTLTQSGPLAVLLQRQRDAVIRLDRHARRNDLRIQHPEWVEAAHGHPDRLRWRRTSIRQASEKLWGVA
jgi:hypothetical protein